MDDLQGGTLALEHRYDLSKRAGEFALFSTYRGVQHPFERPIWVKVCGAPAEHRVPDVYERLKQSVLAAAEFEHPQVLRIVDFGDFKTHVPFVVTERREGKSLTEIVADQGTLAPDEALRIARRVAEIAAEAHAAGLVHGGIAPRWITVTDDGDVFVDHFGLQPNMAEVRAMEGAILSDDLLWPFPPEQFGDDERPLDAAADVWALGALVYWMLTGVHPYYDDPKDTSDAVLRLRNRTRPQALSELGFDEQVSELVDRALAPEMEDRFRDVDELIDALPAEKKPTSAPDRATAVERPAPGPAISTPAEPRAISTALAVAVGLALITNLGWYFYHTATQTEAAPSTSAAAPRAVLPVGVELRTAPEGAKVLLRSDGEAEFGDTPIVLDPKVGNGKLELRLRARGHRDVDLDVVPAKDGQEMTVHLPVLDEESGEVAKP